MELGLTIETHRGSRFYPYRPVAPISRKQLEVFMPGVSAMAISTWEKSKGFPKQSISAFRGERLPVGRNGKLKIAYDAWQVRDWLVAHHGERTGAHRNLAESFWKAVKASDVLFEDE